MIGRMQELSRRRVAGGGEDQAASKEVAESEANLLIPALMAACGLEGIAGYPGPRTREMVVQAHGHWREMAEHSANAAAAAPDVGMQMVCLNLHAYALGANQRQHTLREFDAEAAFGVRGVRLREIIERYSFEQVHPTAKQVLMCCDPFSFGVEPLCLLLWWGDLTAARAGWAKLLDQHKRMRARVAQGDASASGYSYEVVNATWYVPGALLAANEIDILREFMAQTLLGAVLDDEAVHAGAASYWQGSFGNWRTEDGRSAMSHDSWLLSLRAVAELLKGATASPPDSPSSTAGSTQSRRSSASLREWLPSPAELLRIVEYESVQTTGQNHPALICGRLYGERLNDWDTAIVLAEGALAIEQFHPLLRIEAHRLLGRAHAAQGRASMARKAAERAADEAADARYAWLEAMSLGDALKWCGASEAQDIRKRLRGVAARLSASLKELGLDDL